MDIDAYAHVDSPIHRWDPRLKVTALAVFILAVGAVRSSGGLLLAFLIAGSLAVGARLPWRFVLNTLRYPLFFVVAMFPVLALSMGGDTLWAAGPFHLSRESLQTTATIGLRAVSMTLILIVMFSTAKVHVTMQAFEKLRLPAVLVQLLLFTYRYIFLYLEDMKTLRAAARLRGFSLSRGMRRFKTPASLIVVLLIRSFEQSERVAAAMRLRGFNGAFHSGVRFQARPADFLKAGALTALAVGLLLMEFR